MYVFKKYLCTHFNSWNIVRKKNPKLKSGFVGQKIQHYLFGESSLKNAKCLKGGKIIKLWHITLMVYYINIRS